LFCINVFLFDNLQAKLIDVIIEPEVDANAMLESDEMQCLSDKQRADVMAVRGLLACQILAHSLQMRHRVNYGVSRFGWNRTRLFFCPSALSN
jgi:hypothetical protein